MQNIKQKKCVICKANFTPYMSTTKVCSIDCAIKHAEKKNVEREKKVRSLEKKQTREAWLKIQPKSFWLKRSQEAFNKYIRMRDDNQACISCGRHHTGQYHAGHYRTVGSSPHLRFNEDNCHRQCSVCNNHFSGNLIEYRKGLIKKIGAEKVEQLENDNVAKRYTIDDIQELEAYYKAKFKELENETHD